MTARSPLPARILIPVANPGTAEELIRLGAAMLDPRAGELSALGIVEVPEGMPLSEGATRARHDVPAYGFERVIDPPPLEVNTLRLLSEFHAGSLTLADMWRSMLSPDSIDAVLELAAEAGRLGDAARARLGIGGDVSSTTATTLEMAEAASTFHFPDDLWARVIYDLVLTARKPPHPLETLVAALVPIYFGRVGSFVIENRHITTEQAEDRVERQAREFELLKPYLTQRWNGAASEPA